MKMFYFSLEDLGGQQLQDGLHQEGTKLMQFTGLKDKNGKCSFEGDIFAWGEGEDRVVVDGSVEWNEKLLNYGVAGLPLWALRKDAYIIRNIYEMPNLLT